MLIRQTARRRPSPSDTALGAENLLSCATTGLARYRIRTDWIAVNTF